MKKSLRLLTLFAAIMGCVTLYAQSEIPTSPTEVKLDDDVQARFRAILEVPLARNLDFEWGEQVRLHNNLGDVDKIVSSVGLGYKPLNWLKFGVDYRFVNVRDEEIRMVDMKPVSDVEWKMRHQVNVDIVGSYKVGRVKLSLRERVRFNFRTDSVNKYEHANPFISLRSRFKAAYDIRKSRWEPYAYVELYTTLNARDAVPNYQDYTPAYGQYVNRLRFSVGTEVKLAQHHRLDIYYRFHMNESRNARYKAKSGDLKEWTIENQHCHVFGLDYKFKL